MHSLPCSTGGEDGVCVALTELSKELMEGKTSGLQAGGCDSSDCLFCQYRSNSPFHLNAYAGKLTTLLRKRSLNGMTRASLSSLVDTSTEKGAALLSAAAAAMCSAGKRHRTTSNVVPPSAAAVTAASFGGPHGPSVALAAAESTATAATATADASTLHPDHPLDEPHDCLLMCGGRLCSGHTFQAEPSLLATAALAGSAAPVDTAAAVSLRSAAVDATPSLDARLQSEATGGSSAFGHPAPASPSAASSSTAVTHADGAARPQLTEDRAEGTAGPGPSSLHLLQLLQHRQHARHHHHYHQHHRPLNPHHSHRDDRPQSGPSPAAAALLPEQQQAQTEPEGPNPHGQGPPSQQEPRLVGGRPLPEGWAFRSEWQDRLDPAPAALQELLRLPNAASCSLRDGRASQFGRGGSAGGACGGSAGIVCALEFSPDGRLLAAGGVDKQIRLYNLSGALEDLGDEEEEDVDILMGLGPRPPCGGHRDAGRIRRRGRCGDNDTDEDDDDDDARDGSLLAAVQRMPSKISSLAWSPFLDGVLTVGDYDGVLLQLHIASGHQLADVEAHGGRKIWSVAHSYLTPHLAASASDDRCARLWAGRGLATCVAAVQPNPRAAVCSVDFSPTNEHLLAAACSDRTAYLYDMRSLGRGPLAALRHHSRPASYCRFMGGGRLVTAAIDASLVLWDISGAVPALTGVVLPPPPVAAGAAATVATLPGPGQLLPFNVVQEYNVEVAAAAAHGSGSATAVDVAAPAAQGGDSVGGGGASNLARPCRVFRGHRNEKNFVGLSVRSADGLVACGSECSRAFAYHTSWSDPLATLELPWRGGSAAAATAAACGGGFVSAVCWQPAEAAAVLGLPPLLASATSLGTVNVSVLAAWH